jgi:hypothetical protein
MPKKQAASSSEPSPHLGPAQPRQESIDEGTVSNAGPADEGRIRELAYGYWLAEGKPEGRDAEHWARAKEEVARHSDQQRPERSTKPTTNIEAEDRTTAQQGGRPAGAAKATKAAKSPGQATQTFGQSR